MMKIIEGGYQKGSWLHDRDAYSEEEIEAWNKRFMWLISQGHTWLKDYIWHIKSKPGLPQMEIKSLDEYIGGLAFRCRKGLKDNTRKGWCSALSWANQTISM